MSNVVKTKTLKVIWFDWNQNILYLQFNFRLKKSDLMLWISKRSYIWGYWKFFWLRVFDLSNIHLEIEHQVHGEINMVKVYYPFFFNCIDAWFLYNFVDNILLMASNPRFSGKATDHHFIFQTMILSRANGWKREDTELWLR